MGAMLVRNAFVPAMQERKRIKTERIAAGKYECCGRQGAAAEHWSNAAFAVNRIQQKE
jgi:hypothetical protein